MRVYYDRDADIALVKGKKVYVFATRGGQYAGTPFDTQTGFIRNLLGLIGITDVEFIYAEGLARTEIKDAALEKAHEQLAALAV